MNRIAIFLYNFSHAVLNIFHTIKQCLQELIFQHCAPILALHAKHQARSNGDAALAPASSTVAQAPEAAIFGRC
jgi:hypothetical protein